MDSENIISEAVVNATRTLPQRWDGSSVFAISDSSRDFISDVVSAGAYSLLPSVNRMIVDRPAGVEVVEVQRGVRVQIEGADGVIYGVTVDRDRRNGSTSMQFNVVPADRRFNDHVDIVGYATVMTNETLAFARSSALLGDFARVVEVQRAFAQKAGLDLSPKTVQEVSARMSPISYFTEIVALDGGVPGPICLEVAKRMQTEIGWRVMDHLSSTFAETRSALIDRGAAWPEGCLVYNDLDNYVAAAGDARRGGVIHRNISLVSDYRTYALVHDLDDQYKLFAIKDGTADFDNFVRALLNGDELPQAEVTFSNGEVSADWSAIRGDVLSMAACGFVNLREVLFSDAREDSDLEVSRDVSMLSRGCEDEEENPSFRV